MRSKTSGIHFLRHCGRLGLLEMWRHLDARLHHDIAETLAQIVHTMAHLVDARYYLIGHGLEAILYTLQHILHLQ